MATEKVQHTVEAWVWEVGLPPTKYGSRRKNFKRAAIEPLACLVEYPGIQASKVTIRGYALTIYRSWDTEWRSYSTWWTTDYQSAVRYARRRDGRYSTV